LNVTDKKAVKISPRSSSQAAYPRVVIPIKGLFSIILNYIKNSVKLITKINCFVKNTEIDFVLRLHQLATTLHNKERINSNAKEESCTKEELGIQPHPLVDFVR